MDYDVTKSAMEETFSVPTVVVDKFLKLTNPTHLQILLWMLRVGLPMSSAKVSEQMHLDKTIVCEAMFYWIECGILVPCSDDEPQQPSEQTYKVNKCAINSADGKTAPCELKTKTKKAIPNLGSTIADASQLLKRAEESEGFKFLLEESQQVFGRTISRAEQSMLLSLMDNYGLPPEVIMMLIQYCVSAGKKGTAYIQKTGEGWAEEGIFTLEAAEEKIASLRAVNKLWTELAIRIGNSNPRPTKKQEDYLTTWNKQWHFSIDIIHFAYEEMADRCARPSFAYVNKILDNWHSCGVKSLKDAKALCEAEAAKHSVTKNTSTEKTSYDIDKAEKKIKSTRLVYTKRGEK